MTLFDFLEILEPSQQPNYETTAMTDAQTKFNFTEMRELLDA